MSEAGAKTSCIRFDSIDQIKGGWISVNGGSPERFDEVSSIESDSVSISNLDYESLFKTGLSTNSKIRASDYLDVHFNTRDQRKKSAMPGQIENRIPNDLVSVLGMDEDDWESQVKNGSAVFSRVFEIASEANGFKAPPPYSLKKGIRLSSMGYDPVIKSPALYEAITTAVSYGSITQKPPGAIEPDVDCLVSLGVPRVTHALDILSKPLPKFNTEWKKLAISKIRKAESKAFVESLSEHGIYLLRVNILSFSEEYSYLINHGTRASTDLGRRWITGAEAFFYKDIAQFEIFQVYEAESVVECDAYYPALSEMFTPGRHDFSLSAGIFMQNIWTGMSTMSRPPPHVIKDNEAFNPYTPFIRAYDKLALLELSKILYDQDILIHYYGKGEIQVVLKDYQMDPGELFKKFEMANVIPYGLKMDISDDQVDQSNPYNILRRMHFNSDTSALLELDQQLYRHNKD